MRQFLVFRLGDETYGLDVVQLQEIVEDPVLFYVPRARPPWRGAINVHGSVLPVLDLAESLGVGQKGCDRRILVLDPGLCALALAVTSVQGIARLDEETESESEEEGAEEMRPPAFGAFEVLSVAGQKIHLLDLKWLLARLEKTLDREGRDG